MNKRRMPGPRQRPWLRSLKFVSLLTALAAVACIVYAAQQDSDVRGLFIDSRPTKTDSKSTPPDAPGTKVNSTGTSTRLGFGYTIFMDDAQGPKRTDAQHTFHSGDEVRLLIETNTNAYLYVFHQEGSEPATLLYPAEQVHGGENLMAAHKSSFIPNPGWFQFDSNPGEEKLTLIVSQKPLANVPRGSALTPGGFQLTGAQLEKLVADAQPSTSSSSADEGKRLSPAEGARGLVLTDADPGPSHVVMKKPSATGAGWVVARISLVHR